MEFPLEAFRQLPIADVVFVKEAKGALNNRDIRLADAGDVPGRGVHADRAPGRRDGGPFGEVTSKITLDRHFARGDHE